MVTRKSLFVEGGMKGSLKFVGGGIKVSKYLFRILGKTLRLRPFPILESLMAHNLAESHEWITCTKLHQPVRHCVQTPV